MLLKPSIALAVSISPVAWLAAPAASEGMIGGSSMLPSGVAASFIYASAETQGFAVKPISGKSGASIAVSVSLPERFLSSSTAIRGPMFLMFRRVPPAISFSAGFRQKDAWVVSLKDIGRLTLVSEQGYAGAVTMQAVLYQGYDFEPLIRDVLVDLKIPDSAGVTSSSTAEAPQASSMGENETRPPPHVRLTSAEVTELLRRADTLLHASDFQSARLIYSELADDGSAQAALLMARTFDPDVLRTAFIVGMTPDIETAKHWYRKAAELGAAGAQQRLDILAAQR
jgi:hypothetical protein